jgi:hypothetical protein
MTTQANNVLIDDDLRCVISDFGQSELRSEVYRLSHQPQPREYHFCHFYLTPSCGTESSAYTG